MTSLRTIFKGTAILLVLCAGVVAHASDSPCFTRLNYNRELSPVERSNFSNVMECEGSDFRGSLRACFARVLNPESGNPEYAGNYRLHAWYTNRPGYEYYTMTEVYFPGQTDDYGSSPDKIVYSEKFSGSGFAGFWPLGGVWSDAPSSGSGKTEVVVNNQDNTITRSYYKTHTFFPDKLLESTTFTCRKVQ